MESYTYNVRNTGNTLIYKWTWIRLRERTDTSKKVS